MKSLLAGGAVRGTLSEALGQGSFKDAMKGSLFDVMQATAFTGVGDFGNAFKLQDSGLSKTALHAVVGGLLSEAMGGDFKTGAMAAGANEALIVALDRSPLLSGNDPAEHDRLVNAASKLVGLLAAASVDGDVAMGSEIAGNAQSYNRKLHALEQKRIDEEATKLEGSQVKSRSGLAWGDLLTYVAEGEVDDQSSRKLSDALDKYGPNNPTGQRLLEDLDTAQNIISKIQNEKVLLTWSDGSPVVAHGEKVYAFGATSKQFEDSLLFNSSSGTTYKNADGGASIVPDKWVEQYGEAVATKKLREIGAVSSDVEVSTEQWTTLRNHLHSNDSANGNIDLEVLAALLFKGRPAEATFPTATKELVGREILAGTETKTLKERVLEFKASRQAAEDAPPKFEAPPDGYPDAKDTASGLVSGETVVVGNGKAAANDASFDGAKDTASDLVSGETGVVGNGKTAANDASFDGAKGPGQLAPDAISPPKLSSVEDLFGQTFESIPLSHLPNWKTGSRVNDGVLGEQLALQTLNEKTGLNFKPLQNTSNHGCDGCAVAIDGDTITVVVMDAKSSVNGVSKAGTPHGDPRTRLEGWLGNRSIADSDPALRDALQAALDSGKTKVQGVTVKVGVPAPGKTGVAEFKVEPWTKK